MISLSPLAKPKSAVKGLMSRSSPIPAWSDAALRRPKFWQARASVPNRIVCAEEGWGQSGIGAEIAARVVAEAFDYLDAPPERVFQADVPLPYAANLEALSLPGTKDVVEAAKRACYVD